MLRLFMFALVAFAVAGCGGGSSSSGESSYARDILYGNTFYYTDPYLDDPTGYYSDYFGDANIEEKEHAGDGTVLYAHTASVSYGGNGFTFSAGGLTGSCTVQDEGSYVQMQCSGSDGTSTNYKIWDTISDAKANPNM